MKILHIFIVILFCTTPLYADQALVLTEIEQIQEKIWYLQRDFAAQKASLEKQREQLKEITTQLGKDSDTTGEQLNTLGQTVTAQEQLLLQMEGKLQSLNETLFELNNKVEQQDSTLLEMTGKIGVLEGSLQALRTELSSQQSRNDQTMVEMRKQLADAIAKLDNAQQSTKGQLEQVGIWGGAAVLGLAVILTIVFALGGSKRKREREQKSPPRHEL